MNARYRIRLASDRKSFWVEVNCSGDWSPCGEPRKTFVEAMDKLRPLAAFELLTIFTTSERDCTIRAFAI